MEIPLIRLEFTEEDIAYIKDEIDKVLRSGFLTMAESVEEFEQLFARYCAVKFAVGTNSGTSSIEIILRAIDVEGGTVVMPSNTFMATPFAAVKAGAKIIFTECERDNLQMDPDDLKRKIREDTKAVVIVHIGGIISPRFDEIKRICEEYNLPLVEDAAHAHGAEISSLKAGNLGLAGSFSFYPTKVLTTAEGGMMTTNDEGVYKKAIILREHGKANHNYNVHTEIGDNWRFSELHAVLGLQQMKKIDYIISERRRLAALYDKLLEDPEPYKKVFIPKHIKSVYYKYVLFLPESTERSAFKSEVYKRFNIRLTGEIYSNPCHNQPVFHKYPHLRANAPSDKFPVTDYVSQNHVCLPIYPGLKDEEVEYVVNSLKQMF